MMLCVVTDRGDVVCGDRQVMLCVVTDGGDVVCSDRRR